jgi:hypothetical protein
LNSGCRRQTPRRPLQSIWRYCAPSLSHKRTLTAALPLLQSSYP